MSGNISKLICQTTWGDIAVCARAGRIFRVTIPYINDKPDYLLKYGKAVYSNLKDADKRALDLAETYISELLCGRHPHVEVPVDLSSGSSFMQTVWRRIGDILWGQTLTYGAIAREIGRSGAARAVGRACGINPIPLIIPCHRVVGQSGPGGFSAGMAWKEELLTREHV